MVRGGTEKSCCISYQALPINSVLNVNERIGKIRGVCYSLPAVNHCSLAPQTVKKEHLNCLHLPSDQDNRFSDPQGRNYTRQNTGQGHASTETDCSLLYVGGCSRMHVPSPSSLLEMFVLGSWSERA